MTGRLLVLSLITLAAAGAAGVATAAAIVSFPAIAIVPSESLSPGIVSLMGAALALAYGLMRPRKAGEGEYETVQAITTDFLPWANMAIASSTPANARPAATHSGDA